MYKFVSETLNCFQIFQYIRINIYIFSNLVFKLVVSVIILNILFIILYIPVIIFYI